MGNTKSQVSTYEDGSLEINLANFKLLRVVGKGSYGKVRVVELKTSDKQVKETYALKYIRKIDCVRADFAHNIIRERRILQEVEHPLIVNLRYAFQDEEFMYMVSDLMLGGDLRFHINRKTFSEDAVRFWIAEVACALKYLHSRGIVHRDVKPDNILLDAEGHAHLADFNVATYLHPTRKLTGRSGTAAYMAPEVYSGVGYQTSPDFFSLGVTFYESIYGRLPFEADKGDSLSRQIQFSDPPFPKTSPPVSNLCVLAMSGLLERDPHTRLGASSWSSLTDHPFFAPLDFLLLENKRCAPVFHPSAEKSNFDAVYELEELLLEQEPLEGRARKAAKKQQQMQQQMQQHGGVPARDGSDIRRSKKEFVRRKGRSDEDKEEEILEMINQFFESYDYTRHEGNPQALANLTKEIRRLSMHDTVTPGSTPPGAQTPDTPGSRSSTGHGSSRSVPPMPPVPTSYTSPSPSPDADRVYQRHPSPPPRSQYPPPQFFSSQSSESQPLTIRPPPAVARIAGKEKKRHTTSSGGFVPPNLLPTSHPTSLPKETKSGIMSWGKKDTRSSEKWESGVIGRERARVIIDRGNSKRSYPV